jgi:deoxyxylulose-5-phosphate synthase
LPDRRPVCRSSAVYQYPHHVSETVANYIAAEQDLGRVRADVDPGTAADLLLGACFQHAFLSRFADTAIDEETAEHTAAALVQTLLIGLAPER